jgi:hypothetical protein
MPQQRSRAQHALALACLTSLLFLALYVARLCPSLSLTGDSAELVSAAALWGVPHPPGYPLYTAIGHAFAALPTHALPWRIHLTSAVFHACTLGVVCFATFNLTRSRTAAAAAACALGLSRTFLLGSLYAEVFPLNDLFFAGLMALALGASSTSARKQPRARLLFALCAGLALSHHLMIVLAAPALAVLTAGPLARGVRADRKHAAMLALALLTPLLIYALVPLAASRSPALSWGEVHDLRALVRLVTRQDYGGPFSPTRTPSPEPSVGRVVAFGGLVAKSMGMLPLGLAALGLGREIFRRRAIGVSLLLGIALPGPIFAWANSLNTGSEETLAYFERFTSMCHVPLAIALGAGVGVVQSTLGAKRGAAIVFGLALGLLGLHSVRRSRDVDLSTDNRGIAFAHDLVLASPDRALILLSGDEPASAALYVCEVEHACGDRIILSPGSLFLPWRMAQVRARYPGLQIPWTSGPALRRTHEIAAAAIGDRPVFVYPTLFEKDPDLEQAFTRFPDRLLFRLWPGGSVPASGQAAFLASARAMARGQGCEGCTLFGPIAPRPSQDVQIVEAYEAAFTNHARVARAMAGAEELAAAHEARAREMSEVVSPGGDTHLTK